MGVADAGCYGLGTVTSGAGPTSRAGACADTERVPIGVRSHATAIPRPATVAGRVTRSDLWPAPAGHCDPLTILRTVTRILLAIISMPPGMRPCDVSAGCVWGLWGLALSHWVCWQSDR
jgi:hypothetical protein